MSRVVKREEVLAGEVGASEVGALLGCDPWTTPLQLYRRKKGLDEPRPDNAAMAIGRALEGPVVDLAREQIPLRVMRNRRTFVHPTAPLFATPDAFVAGERLLEVKVVGLRSPDAYEEELPCRVRLQVQAQLAVTGREACYVAQLVGTDLRFALVYAEPAVQETILEAARAFRFEHLEPSIPPDPLTWDERWFDLLERLAGTPERELLAGAAAQEAGDRILSIRREEALLADEAKSLRLELLRELETWSGTRIAGTGWTATLQTTAGRVDWKALATELQDHALEATPEAERGEVAKLFVDDIYRHRGAPSTTLVVRSSSRE